MKNLYLCDQADARSDWEAFARELAEGAVPPPNDLLAVVGKAAGGIPKGVKPLDALKASAMLIVESECADA